MKRRRRRKEVSSREWGTKAKRGSCEVMKFEKESIFMQILNERRRRRKKEREKNPSWKLVYQSRKQKTKCES